MLYDVPLLPDEAYADFLAGCAHRLHSVHFSLHSPLAADARPPGDRLTPGRLAALLGRIDGPRKFALLNSRFHAARDYTDSARLLALAGLLDELRQRAGLTGIVYSDHYLLQALSDAAPETCAELEAVPSVNAMLTGPADVLRRLEFIGATAFRPPSRVVLDRSLNRDMARLSHTVGALREHAPGVAVVLLANEGCLADCPFKHAHDSLIALGSHACGAADAHAVTSRLGCGRIFATDARQVFQSPFIRPEDATAYEPLADALKLCGRTRGPRAMRRIVTAYLRGAWDGNLLDLLDAMELLAPSMHVDNAALPPDFHDTVTACGGVCNGCSYCSGLAARHVQRVRPAATLGRV